MSLLEPGQQADIDVLEGPRAGLWYDACIEPDVYLANGPTIRNIDYLEAHGT